MSGSTTHGARKAVDDVMLFNLKKWIGLYVFVSWTLRPQRDRCDKSKQSFPVSSVDLEGTQRHPKTFYAVQAPGGSVKEIMGGHEVDLKSEPSAVDCLKEERKLLQNPDT